MTTDDPFFNDDSDRTVIRPSPGGRRATGSTPPPPPSRPAAPPRASADCSIDSGINPLVTSASSLLSLISKLRNTLTHPDVNSLRLRLEQELQRYEAKATSAGIDRETIHAARYCLCTVIDETVLNTPWGNESSWSNNSLLVHFHQEAWGGEKVFAILERMLKEPGRHLHMLELLYISLSMGFQGRYRVVEGGQHQLEQISDSIYNAIRGQRGEFERDLSPHGYDKQQLTTGLRNYLPLWVVGTIAGALLLSTFLVFSYFINTASDPLFKELNQIGREQPPTVEAALAPKPIQSNLYERLSQLLAAEIQEGLIEVIDGYSDIVIRLRNKGLFPSGSVQVSAQFKPLLKRISEVLSTTDSTVIVAGHSDNTPIHSVRFPSNWHLSLARAEAVTTIMQANLSNSVEITAEGRADNEPLVSNDTPKNRAINRRVEIILEK
ncbi:MAG: type IVB secretion system protein IcmH/DotU [Candidatus Polarisedimenticolaceae bacterium]|nr:type IVB secretion system protein IcmH/DotU [Candidatus Polarisedimenticolaceae bacterium]